MRTHFSEVNYSPGVIAVRSLPTPIRERDSGFESFRRLAGRTVRLEIRVIGARGADARRRSWWEVSKSPNWNVTTHRDETNLSLPSSVVYDYTVMP